MAGFSSQFLGSHLHSVICLYVVRCYADKKKDAIDALNRLFKTPEAEPLPTSRKWTATAKSLQFKGEIRVRGTYSLLT